jgi:hypothetical protein
MEQRAVGIASDPSSAGAQAKPVSGHRRSNAIM